MRRLIPLLLLLTGCSLEPRYHRPDLELPCAWRVESDETTTLVNIRWWESLGDPILNALILTALDNNKDLQVAAWRVCEYLARYQVARSPLFPQVNFEASALKERFPADASFLPAGFNPITPFYTWDFTLGYEIDFWGKISSGAHATCAEALEQLENRRTVVLTLVGAVAQGYVTLRELDKELQISYLTLEARKEAVQYARDRFEGGLTSEIELTQAISAYDETLAAITILEEQIPQQENLISVLLGKNPTCILRGKEVEEFTLPPEVPAGLPSELLERRPDILGAENLLMATVSRIGIARANFFPSFSITGLYGGKSLEFSQLFSGASRAWQIGIDIFEPIFTGGKLTGELKIAQAQVKEALYHYEQVILTAFQEVDDALIGFQQSKKLVEVETDRVEALKEYLKLAWLRYYNGQTEYITVLDAERQLFRGEIDLAKAQGKVFITLIDVYKSLGGGWVIDADFCLRG